MPLAAISTIHDGSTLDYVNHSSIPVRTRTEDAAKRANLQRTVPMNWDRGSLLIPCKEMMTTSDLSLPVRAPPIAKPSPDGPIEEPIIF